MDRPAKRAMLAMAFAAIPGCRPMVEHRDFAPSMPGMTVEIPGERGMEAAQHVVPPDAIDRRSAVLVYSQGADVVEAPDNNPHLRAAEVRVQFRARNDEQVPLVMDPQNVLLVIGPESSRESVVGPAWIEAEDEGEHNDEDGNIVVAPGRTASWALVFVLPASKEPLRRMRAFLVSWTYRLGETAFEERTHFVAVMRRGGGWRASNALVPTAH